MDLKNFIEKNSAILQIVGVVLLIIAILYLLKKRSESMYDLPYGEYSNGGVTEGTEQPQVVEGTEGVPTEIPVVGATGQEFSSNDQNFMGSAINFETTGKDILPVDLLPKSDVPLMEGELTPTSDLSARNYLVSSNNFGIDTVGSSNKLANLQLRSDPYIASKEIGPWNNSSVTSNQFQRNFDIGN
jgi:hypothetical protein